MYPDENRRQQTDAHMSQFTKTIKSTGKFMPGSSQCQFEYKT